MYLDGYMLGGGLNNPLAPSFFFSPDALVQLPILMNENRIVQLAQKPLKKKPQSACRSVFISGGWSIPTARVLGPRQPPRWGGIHQPPSSRKPAAPGWIHPWRKETKEKRCDAQVLEENGPFTAIRMFVHSARFGLRWLDKKNRQDHIFP